MYLFHNGKSGFEIELRARGAHLCPKRGLQIPATTGVLLCSLAQVSIAANFIK